MITETRHSSFHLFIGLGVAMPEAEAESINKKEIGTRIKKLRKEAGLRQWQLAEMIGATQPAIHMYERGVLPEPKRLLELARIGNTTVEWILTGRHWENGSEEMHRVPEDIYRLAFHLKEYSDEDREALESALEVITSAVAALRRTGAEETERMPLEEIEGGMSALAAALRIQGAVKQALMSQATDRLRRSGLHGDIKEEADSSPETPGKQKFTARAAGIEAVRGHIYRIDGSLLIINELLKDKDLRTEFEETLGRLGGKLESKKSRNTKMKRAQRSK